MYGAILSEIIGSPYEFDMGDKTKDFPLFHGRGDLAGPERKEQTGNPSICGEYVRMRFKPDLR